MSGTDLEIAQARARAEAARGRINLDVQVLKYKLSPSTIASNAWNAVRGKGEDVAGQASDTAHRHPISLSVAGAAALLFFVRKPVARLVGRLFERKHDATERREYSLTAGYDPQSPAAPMSGLVQVHEEKAQ